MGAVRATPTLPTSKWPGSGGQLAANPQRNPAERSPNLAQVGDVHASKRVARQFHPGWWRRGYYARPGEAEAIGTAAVQWLRGSRAAAAERRAKAYAEQAERIARTGFAGGEPEVGNAVRFELLERGYLPAVAEYGAQLASVGRWNFQGNPRLASIVRRSLRSVQRYRAQLEADGLLRSYCLEPGDMIDGQRAPVSRPQIVREVLIRAAALERIARRPAPPRTRAERQAQRRQNTRARRIVTAPAPSPSPLTLEEMQQAAKRPGVATWVGQSLEGQGRRTAVPAEPTPAAELDELDDELRELGQRQQRQRDRLEQRARPPPPE